MPGAVLAEACTVQRPNWDGAPVSALQEAVSLASSPIVLVLLVLSAMAFRFKSHWGTLTLVVLWSLLVAFLSLFAPDARTAGMAEGCIGSPALFIGIIAAICVGMIFYTAPAENGRSSNGE